MKYAKHAWTVVSDPLEIGALATGFRLNDQVVVHMLDAGTFTPGTVLRSGSRDVVVHGNVGARQHLRDTKTLAKER